MRNLLHISIIFPIFVMLSYIIGARVPDIEGIFFALEHKDTALPCRSRNSFGSPDEGLSKGRGGIPFLLPPQNLNAMLKNSSGDDVALASEIWKDIEGYEGLYQVSNLGRVRSLKRIVRHSRGGPFVKTVEGRIMSITHLSRGYRRVNLCVNNIRRSFSVHRLVASAFIKNSKGFPEVNHLNGVKTDNGVANLEWCTSSENSTHAIRLGLQKPTRPWLGKMGILNPASKPVLQFTKQGKMIAEYASAHEAMRATGIDFSFIAMCCRGKCKTAKGFIWKYKEVKNEKA